MNISFSRIHSRIIQEDTAWDFKGNPKGFFVNGTDDILSEVGVGIGDGTREAVHTNKNISLKVRLDWA